MKKNNFIVPALSVFLGIGLPACNSCEPGSGGTGNTERGRAGSGPQDEDTDAHAFYCEQAHRWDLTGHMRPQLEKKCKEYCDYKASRDHRAQVGNMANRFGISGEDAEALWQYATYNIFGQPGFDTADAALGEGRYSVTGSTYNVKKFDGEWCTAEVLFTFTVKADSGGTFIVKQSVELLWDIFDLDAVEHDTDDSLDPRDVTGWRLKRNGNFGRTSEEILKSGGKKKGTPQKLKSKFFGDLDVQRPSKKFSGNTPPAPQARRRPPARVRRG